MKNSVIVKLFMLAFFAFVMSCKKEITTHKHKESAIYTCPMHPEIIRDKPGNCPICGMSLVEKVQKIKAKKNDLTLEILLKPTNEVVLFTIPVTSVVRGTQPIELKLLGRIDYDTHQIGSVSARVEGRIEKLYIRSRFQKISKGQRILDIYSPEMLSSQENLIFLLKNDAKNSSMINAAKQKLLLLGMSLQQLNHIAATRKPQLTVGIFSNYSGYVRDASNSTMSSATNTRMNALPNTTAPLSVREGMYVKMGQTIFTIYNPNRAWAVLNVNAADQKYIKRGQSIYIVPEIKPESKLKGTVDFIEPFLRPESRTVAVRTYFDNTLTRLPIGSQVTANIQATSALSDWLPRSAVISLGLDKVVFKKNGNAFKAYKVETGSLIDEKIEILSGLSSSDSVVVNAQYLADSESFIKIQNK